MNRSLRRTGLTAGLLLLAAIAVSGCEKAGPSAPHLKLGRDLSAARAAFNADSGKVRILLLLSPT
ncbi:MAG: hypothetical protein HZB25_14345 [Candidatus Eisenbacteria bacterium]|nr:hypothetical protein [Candidatus Eisenbacteria bacterium]